MSGNRCKWLRGRWACDKNKTVSRSTDQQQLQLQSRVGAESELHFEQRRHQSAPENLTLGTPWDDMSVRQESGVKIEMSAALIDDKKFQRKIRANKQFKRAFSCDAKDLAEVGNISEDKIKRCEDLEMTAVQMESDVEAECVGIDINDGSESISNQLKTFHRDTGIVCSDEDLHSILTSSSETNRISADVRREKMKSNRSLSLDSSFFKLKIKRLQADSPMWLSKFINQKDKTVKDASSSGDNAAILVENNGEEQDAGASASITAATVNVLPCSGLEKPPTITEDTSSLEGDISSRRESTISGGTSDDESSLLLRHHAPEEFQIEPEMKAPEPIKTTTVASKVLWNEESVVDAQVLGHAIEFYLTSTIKTTTTMTSSNRNEGTQNHCKGNRNSVPDTIAPVVSTLKGLFVK